MTKLFAILWICTVSTAAVFLLQFGQEVYAWGDPAWQKLGLFLQALALSVVLAIAFQISEHIDNFRRY